MLSNLTPFASIPDPTYGENVYTCFIPDNAAWLAHSTNNTASVDIENLLGAHIIPGQVLYSPHGQLTAKSRHGNEIHFNDSGGNTLNQTFRYVLADIPLDAGVMHIIDRCVASCYAETERH